MLLDKCGLWGCILGGTLCSNIAQYILTSNLGLRGECCFLSAYFFKAMFRASLPHPLADRDYTAYEVGEGCEVTSLVPCVDLISTGENPEAFTPLHMHHTIVLLSGTVWKAHSCGTSAFCHGRFESWQARQHLKTS